MPKFIVHYVPHTHYDAEVFLSRDETFEIGYSVLLGALAAMRTDPEVQVRAGPDVLHRALPEDLPRRARLPQTDDRGEAAGDHVRHALDARRQHPLRRIVHPAGAAGQGVVPTRARRRRPVRLADRFVWAASADTAAHGQMRLRSPCFPAPRHVRWADRILGGRGWTAPSPSATGCERLML